MGWLQIGCINSENTCASTNMKLNWSIRGNGNWEGPEPMMMKTSELCLFPYIHILHAHSHHKTAPSFYVDIYVLFNAYQCVKQWKMLLYFIPIFIWVIITYSGRNCLNFNILRMILNSTWTPTRTIVVGFSIMVVMNIKMYSHNTNKWI